MFEHNMAWMAITALVSGAALQVVLALAGYRSRQRPSESASALRAAQHEIHMLHAAVAALTRRLGALEEQPAAPAAVASSACAPAPRFETHDPAYDLAGKLARKGVAIEELMETCGLSRGEVDLIARLNAPEQEAVVDVRRRSTQR
jgi:Tfp pilus assembly protein FimV